MPSYLDTSIHSELKVIVDHKSFYISFSDIVRFEGSENYCFVHTVEGNSYKCARTLKKIEMLIDLDKFLRIHKKHIVNKTFVKEVLTTQNKVLLTTGELVEISRRRLKEVKTEIKNALSLIL